MRMQNELGGDKSPRHLNVNVNESILHHPECGFLEFDIKSECFVHADELHRIGQLPSHSKQYINNIARRLETIRDLFPFWVLLEVDDEGRAVIDGVVEQCHGRVLMTDGGGGKLTDIHWNVVINHIGYVEIIVWSQFRADIDLIKAECINTEYQKLYPINIALFEKEEIELDKSDCGHICLFKETYPFSESFNLSYVDVMEFVHEHNVTDEETYGLMVCGKIVEDDDHLLALAVNTETIVIEFRHVVPKEGQRAEAVYKWLKQSERRD